MEFVTIKTEAKRGLVAEYRLREWLKRGELPGFYAGTRFYVNHEGLLKKLESLSDSGRDHTNE